MKDKPYRPCVGVMLVNRAGLVFVGKRHPGDKVEHDSPEFDWQMPQGGVDKNEDVHAAALRELREETNVSSVSLIAEHPEWLSYDLPVDFATKAWKGRYRGQTQKWFAFRFEGDDSEIDVLTPDGGKHKPEFITWKWERIERLAQIVIPFKRPIYEKVAESFAPLIKV
jgi:putative (di)nucleoside polyphosphate hydrolase